MFFDDCCSIWLIVFVSSIMLTVLAFPESAVSAPCWADDGHVIRKLRYPIDEPIGSLDEKLVAQQYRGITRSVWLAFHTLGFIQQHTSVHLGSFPIKTMGKSSRPLGLQCWTCRARRVRCDSQFPACSNCGKKNLDCLGYAQDKPVRWRPVRVPTGSRIPPSLVKGDDICPPSTAIETIQYCV